MPRTRSFAFRRRNRKTPTGKSCSRPGRRSSPATTRSLRPELLQEDVFLQGLSRTVGRDGVIRQLNESVYRNITWGPAEAGEQHIKVIGKSPPGSPTAGFVLLFEVADGQIAAIRQQPLFGGAPIAAAPVR